MVQNVQLRIFQHDLLYGYKIKRLVGAPGIIFVLMNTPIRQTAPPSDLRRLRVTNLLVYMGSLVLSLVICLYVVSHRYDCYTQVLIK